MSYLLNPHRFLVDETPVEGYSAVLTYAGADTGAGYIRDFFDIPIGVAAPNRRIVVAASFSSFNGGISPNCIVNGISLTRHLYQKSSSGAAAIHSGIIPDGETATIYHSVLTGSSSICAIGVYRCVGLNSGAPYDIDSFVNLTTGNNINRQINVLAGGIIVGATTQWGSGGYAYTAGVTTDYGNGNNLVGHYIAEVDETNHLVRSNGAPSAYKCGVLASFR